MLGAFGTLPGIKQLKQFSHQYPWMKNTVIYLDALFNDKASQRDDLFLAYLQNTAGKNARSDISMQLSNFILKIAHAENPTLQAREWILQLTNEYAPLQVLMSKGEQPGDQVSFTGLNEQAAKVIMANYQHFLHDGVNLDNVYNSLNVRMLRLKFDLSVATFVLDSLSLDDSKSAINQPVLAEHACAYHSLRLRQESNIAIDKPVDIFQANYRSMQTLFLKG
jgi:hypothetical protein